ncbi:MAG: C-OmpA-like family protein CmpA [Legionellaceae bacterium]|nr:C-OmpA-like family protein CmpA [Legionellaceae bacterium]
MSVKNTVKRMYWGWMMLISLFALTLSACNHPPYNDFKKDPPNGKRVGYGYAVGAVVGAALGATFIGTMVGGSTIAVMSYYKTNKSALLNNLRKQDIQFIQYGDTMTLIVPTDHYFMFNSAQLNSICFMGLNNIVRLLEYYPKSRIYVAGFTDNIGTRRHKNKLSQAQAETMLGFLWAHGIPAELLIAQGYGDRYSIGDNRLIRGSAFNRRIEIQWSALPAGSEQASPMSPMQGPMK